MKHCPDHFRMIIDEIKRHGMWHLVSLDHGKVANGMHRWLKGDAMERGDFNPLPIIVCEIFQRATTYLPSYVSSRTHDYCPLCEAVKLKGRGEDKRWVDGYSLSTRKLCTKLGMVKALIEA